jgi:hypothetical protein
MGDRVSIQFTNDWKTLDMNVLDCPASVVFFSHWDGINLVNTAVKYIKELKEDISSDKVSETTPLGRLEPQTVMIDFILVKIHQLKQCHERNMSNYYLGTDQYDGDNSDNGHFVIDMSKERVHGQSPISDIPFNFVRELN